MEGNQFNPETGQTHWRLVIIVALIFLGLFIWAKRDSIKILIDKTFSPDITKVEKMAMNNLIGKGIYMSNMPEPSIKDNLIGKNHIIVNVNKMKAGDTIVYLPAVQPECDWKIPKGYKLLYNKTTQKYTFKKWEGVLWSYMNETNGRINWWLAEDSDPLTFKDSCSAKKRLRQDLEGGINGYK
jgi:hypothetical protein